ncbi:hypothetical protein [Azospirillum argentinense]
MTEGNGNTKKRPSYGFEPKTIAATGGVGAVCGAVTAVLIGRSVVTILGSAAITGVACALVGLLVSLHRNDADDNGSSLAATPP